MSSIQGNREVLYPQVSAGGPGAMTGVGGLGSEQKGAGKPQKGEFDNLLQKTEISLQPEKSLQGKPEGADLGQIRTPLKFSQHASQRLQERKIALDASTMARVNDAIDKAAAKGVEDTLVLTDRAALIVNTKNRTVVTAMDRNNLAGNIFTNIDGAVVV